MISSYNSVSGDAILELPMRQAEFHEPVPVWHSEDGLRTYGLHPVPWATLHGPLFGRITSGLSEEDLRAMVVELGEAGVVIVEDDRIPTLRRHGPRRPLVEFPLKHYVAGGEGK